MGNCFKKEKPVKTDTTPRKRSRRMTPMLDTIIHKSSIHPSIITMNVKDFWKIHEIIGKGHFGAVYRGTPVDNLYKNYAIKSIPKKMFRKDNRIRYLKGELETLQMLDHPNIIKLYQSYEDSSSLYLVTEYCSGGKLLDKIITRRVFSEKEAASIILKILKTIFYLHANNISHRDIKPDNFLFENNSEKAELKLIDFGLSKICGSEARISSVVGTPQYVAPEVLEGNYDSKCDLWSLGAIMYLMLTGKMAMDVRSPAEAFVALKTKEVRTQGPDIDMISASGKDLLWKLLKKNPRERIDARDALEHKWFTEQKEKKSIGIDPEIFHCLKKYKYTSLLKKDAMDIIVKDLTYAEICDLRKAFVQIDKSNLGVINIDDLSTAAKKAKYKLKDNDIMSIFANVGSETNLTIKYSEFLAATLSYKNVINEKLLRETFSAFDINECGFINEANFIEALKRRGNNVDPEKVKSMIKDLGKTNPGFITFEEFKAEIVDKDE
ncbi:unnamed protein product [Blepharisma stoltei]|uniref:non-specific serine/threonine protein kinase n=1 Tax=Blepharisma stoltei TaxID=1481888 RepID=A0AAU9JWN3_9CILI|nr:unnamed protein product [Blepharisma stoltei]